MSMYKALFVVDETDFEFRFTATIKCLIIPSDFSVALHMMEILRHLPLKGQLFCYCNARWSGTTRIGLLLFLDIIGAMLGIQQ